MPTQYSVTESLEIIYHRDYRILIGRFLRPLSEEENRQCYLDLLAAAHQYSDARYWLLDIRRRHRSGPATLAWLLDTFYPQLIRELGTPFRLVYFMAPGLRQEFQVDGTVPEPHTYDPAEPFRMNQCITEREAVQWLLQEQQVQA
jgi:hypothetical protein